MRVNIWGRSWWYRLYIIVGIPAVIALSVLAVSNADPRDPSMLPILAPVLGWVAGLLVFQWTFLLRRGVGPVAPEGEDPPADAADPPLDREALRATLALDDGEEDAGTRAAPTPQTFAVRGFAYITALTLAAVGGSVLYATGVVDATIEPFGAGGPGIPVAVLPALALVLIGVLRLPSQLRQAVEVSDAWSRGLGLRATNLPLAGSDVDATVYEGDRHGRAVWIEQAPRASSVHVAQPVPSFAARERELALVPEPGAPPSVTRTLGELSTHRRWSNVRVTGGADGVLVERERGATEALQALWLDDLWLAERLADAAAADSQ
jgi:hypothetical protein